MKNLIAGIGLIALVAGCAASHNALQQYGDYELDGTTLKSLTVSSSGTHDPDKLVSCVAATVRNDSVTLTDAAGSFVGPYSGAYYNVGNTHQAGGGSVIQYVSRDGRDIVARGITQFSAAMIKSAVRFSVQIKDDGEQRSYRFTGIEQAQLSTGSARNTGFFQVYIQPGSRYGHVMQSLKDLTSEIDACAS